MKLERTTRKVSPKERAICATLLDTPNGELPLYLNRILHHAPESFDDATLGELAVTVRKLRNEGRPVTPAAVAEVCDLPNATSILLGLAGDVLPLDLAEAEAQSVWSDYKRRQMATLFAEAADAVTARPDDCADVARRVVSSLADFADRPEPASKLPGVDNAASLLQDEAVALPPQIIDGVLHQGLKAVLGSNSKARKTWILLDAAISVATGRPFWKWPTRQGRVLYINFEIPRSFIRSRIKCLCERKGVGPDELTALDIWTLRGHGTALWKLMPDLLARIEAGKYVLVIVDPIYKGLGGRDENSAGDIGELCNELERLAVASGAAVLYAAHFSKGNQSGKEAIDRIGGSGVFTRDADSIITLTKHEVEDAYTVDMILRNLPEQPPFVVQWRFPTMEAVELNPDDLKKANGRKREHTEENLLDLLGTKALTTTEWQTLADEERGMSRRTFYTLKRALEVSGCILQSRQTGKWQRAETK